MSAKALSLASELANDLSRRFTTVSGITFDTDGLPLFTVTNGTLAAGQQCALVKVADIAPLGVDVTGAAAKNYGHPIQIQVVLETSTIANVALLTEANEAALLLTLALRGQRMQVYMSANTVAVSVAALVAGSLKATWDPDQKYKTLMGA